MSEWEWLLFGALIAAGAILGIVILVWVLNKILGGGPSSGVQPAVAAESDRQIILIQLLLGAVLVLLGALGALIFGVVLEDEDNIAVAIGTAVIGTGAALLPAGAAARAGSRIEGLERKVHGGTVTGGGQPGGGGGEPDDGGGDQPGGGEGAEVRS